MLGARKGRDRDDSPSFWLRTCHWLAGGGAGLDFLGQITVCLSQTGLSQKREIGNSIKE